MGLVVLVLLIGLAGCSPANLRAKVKGKVKFFDKTLTAGTVAFTSKDGRIGTANIDFEGNYEMNDAPVGEVTITVSVPRMPMGPMPGGAPKPPPGVPEMRPPGEIGGGSTAPAIDPKKIVQIPGKYEKAETSGLTFTVEKGQQTHDITLSP
jgi:hypothetical protein